MNAPYCSSAIRSGPDAGNAEPVARRVPAGNPRHGRGPRRGAGHPASLGKPEDRDAWLRLADARKVLGENDNAPRPMPRSDAIAALAPAQPADWAEGHVCLIAPSPAAVAALKRGENAEPATRWRCSISARRPSPRATSRRPRCCRGTSGSRRRVRLLFDPALGLFV